MSNEDFKNGFYRLVQAFGVAKPDDKMSIYFEELNHIDPKVWKLTVSYILRHELKFPSIATILAVYQNLAPQGEALEKAECRVCDGWGWVRKGDLTYRGACQHGDRWSKTIAKTTRDPTPVMDDMRVAAIIAARPDQFAKGFLVTGSMMKRKQPAFYSRIRSVLIDTVGAERLKRIYAMTIHENETAPTLTVEALHAAIDPQA